MSEGDCPNSVLTMSNPLLAAVPSPCTPATRAGLTPDPTPAPANANPDPVVTSSPGLGPILPGPIPDPGLGPIPDPGLGPIPEADPGPSPGTGAFVWSLSRVRSTMMGAPYDDDDDDAAAAMDKDDADDDAAAAINNDDADDDAAAAAINNDDADDDAAIPGGGL